MVVDDRDHALLTASHVRERMAPEAGIVGNHIQVEWYARADRVWALRTARAVSENSASPRVIEAPVTQRVVTEH